MKVNSHICKATITRVSLVLPVYEDTFAPVTCTMWMSVRLLSFLR